MLSPFNDVDNGADDLIELKLSAAYGVVKQVADNLTGVTAVAGIVDQFATIPGMLVDVGLAVAGVNSTKDTAISDIDAASISAVDTVA